MGQQKGNQIPTTQEQAYMSKYGLSDHTKRDMGVKPVMIDDATTLNEVVDITFETDAVAAMVSASLNTTIFEVSASIGNNIIAVSGSTNTRIAAVSSSIDTRIAAVSSSIDTRLNAVSQSLSSSINIPGTYANDTAAGTAGVKIGGLYHTTGTVKVRLT
jgi:hypothetical protein